MSVCLPISRLNANSHTAQLWNYKDYESFTYSGTLGDVTRQQPSIRGLCMHDNGEPLTDIHIQCHC